MPNLSKETLTHIPKAVNAELTKGAKGYPAKVVISTNMLTDKRIAHGNSCFKAACAMVQALAKRGNSVITTQVGIIDIELGDKWVSLFVSGGCRATDPRVIDIYTGKSGVKIQVKTEFFTVDKDMAKFLEVRLKFIDIVEHPEVTCKPSANNGIYVKSPIGSMTVYPQSLKDRKDSNNG
jgi:hypothetical protein